MLFAYAISMLPSSAPNSRRDNVLQLPTKNFAKKTKLYAFAMRKVLSRMEQPTRLRSNR